MLKAVLIAFSCSRKRGDLNDYLIRRSQESLSKSVEAVEVVSVGYAVDVVAVDAALLVAASESLGMLSNVAYILAFLASRDLGIWDLGSLGTLGILKSSSSFLLRRHHLFHRVRTSLWFYSALSLCLAVMARGPAKSKETSAHPLPEKHGYEFCGPYVCPVLVQ